jgi:hypothetical protein
VWNSTFRGKRKQNYNLVLLLGKNTYECGGAIDPRVLKLVIPVTLLPEKEIKEDFERELAG